MSLRYHIFICIHKDNLKGWYDVYEYIIFTILTKFRQFSLKPSAFEATRSIHKIIPESVYRPHIPSQKELGIFWKRTNTGNEQMTYDEIRGSFGQQSKVTKNIERRRKNRISWFAHHSLSVLDSLKKRYEELYQAIEEYQKNRNGKTKRHIVAIAEIALRISVNHTITLIQRDIQTSMEYINNTWLVAKFPMSYR